MQLHCSVCNLPFATLSGNVQGCPVHGIRATKEPVITTSEAADRIRKSGGKLFGVTFIKRSTRSPRHMVARTGVRKGVTGDGKRFDPNAHNLLTVHEFVTDPETTREDVSGQFIGNGNMGTQFRHVPIENIRELRIGGKRFKVQD